MDGLSPAAFTRLGISRPDQKLIELTLLKQPSVPMTGESIAEGLTTKPMRQVRMTVMH